MGRQKPFEILGGPSMTLQSVSRQANAEDFRQWARQRRQVAMFSNAKTYCLVTLRLRRWGGIGTEFSGRRYDACPRREKYGEDQCPEHVRSHLFVNELPARSPPSVP
jgi:hypothetical protein